MKIPTKIKIGSIVWKIEFVNPSEIDCDEHVAGDQSEFTQTIRLANGLSPEMTEEVLFHEILHCIDSELDHNLVDLISKGYYQTLRENGLLAD